MSVQSNGNATGAPAAIPVPLIAVVAKELDRCHTRTRIECLMEEAGFPGEPPAGNKVDMVRAWLKRANANLPNPLEILGKVLHEMMEVGPASRSRSEVEQALEREGLAYGKGGIISRTGAGLVPRTLDEHIRSRDLSALRSDFDRTAKNIDSDPASAATSTCSLLESLFRIYLEEEKLQMPADKSLKSLWIPVRNHLRLDPSVGSDDDLRKIFGGIGSIVDGIAGLRTHKGSAHGHGSQTVPLSTVHARLAWNAGATLATFILESWK